MEVMRQTLSKYKYGDIAKRDVNNAISHFKDLRPNYDSFIFNDGSSKHLLHLDGTIPVTYKGKIYNIPVDVRILDTHPYNPPMVFVKPTSTMNLKTGRNVDSNGKVDIPYLRDWRYPQSDLLGLIQILVIVFGEEPPVYSKQSQMDQSPPPYTYKGPPFPFPVELQQCNLPVAMSSASTAQDPIPMQGFDSGIFYRTMERFALGEFVNIFVEHGVDCVETFSSMTESDLEEMGLNFGQRRKCILAVQHIKNDMTSLDRN